MSTITIERPEVSSKLPEWRRIRHRYDDDSQISICGTATRKPVSGDVTAHPDFRASAPCSSTRLPWCWQNSERICTTERHCLPP
jgi:hypothetical protein